MIHLDKKRYKFHQEIRKEYIDKIKKQSRRQLAANTNSQYIHVQILSNFQHPPSIQWLQIFRQALSTNIAQQYKHNMQQHLQKVMDCFKLVDGNISYMQLWVQSVATIYYETNDIKVSLTIEVIQIAIKLIRYCCGEWKLNEGLMNRCLVLLRNITATTNKQIFYWCRQEGLLEFISGLIEDYPCSTYHKREICMIYANLLHDELEDINTMQNHSHQHSQQLGLLLLLALTQENYDLTLLTKTIQTFTILLQYYHYEDQIERQQFLSIAENILFSCLKMDNLDQQTEEYDFIKYIWKFINKLVKIVDNELTQPILIKISDLIIKMVQEKLTSPIVLKSIIESAVNTIQLIELQDIEGYGVDLINCLMSQFYHGQFQLNQSILPFFKSILKNNKYYHCLIFNPPNKNYQNYNVLLQMMKSCVLEEVPTINLYFDIIQLLINKIDLTNIHDLITQKVEGCIYLPIPSIQTRSQYILSLLDFTNKSQLKHGIK